MLSECLAVGHCVLASLGTIVVASWYCAALAHMQDAGCCCPDILRPLCTAERARRVFPQILVGSLGLDVKRELSVLDCLENQLKLLLRALGLWSWKPQLCFIPLGSGCCLCFLFEPGSPWP